MGAGSVTHALFGVAGFGALLQSSTRIFTVAKLLGAAYLLWIGYKSLRGVVRSRRSGLIDDVTNRGSHRRSHARRQGPTGDEHEVWAGRKQSCDHERSHGEE